MKNRFVGTLLGAAVGDSMGMCVEEIPIDEVIMHYGDKIKDLCNPHPASPASFLRKGETSSEFAIVNMVATSLIEKGRLDIKDIIEKYIDWEEKEELHNYVDPHFLVAVEALKEGKEISKGGFSIEGALPAIPIGMYHYANPILAVEATKTVVMLTHRHEIVLDVASAIAVAIGEILQGKFYLEDEYHYFLQFLKTFISQKDTIKFLDKIEILLKEDASYEEAINELGNGSFALEAFSQALFIFLKTPSSTENVIIHAVNSYGNYGGDTDSIGLIAGAFVGAYNGEESIPDKWKRELKDYKRIIEIGEKLYLTSPHK